MNTRDETRRVVDHPVLPGERMLRYQDVRARKVRTRQEVDVGTMRRAPS